MSLAGQVQVLALDPIVFNNSRVEWELPDNYYLSDSMVIGNLGVYAPNVLVTNTIAAYYPVTCGVGQCIARFTLMSGSDEIEFLEKVPQWLSHKAINTSYSANEDIHHNTLHNGWGWGELPDQNVAGVAANTLGGLLTLSSVRKDYVTAFNSGGSLSHGNQTRIGASQYPPGTSASLPVKMLSGLLRATPVLPRIPRLRLVIEYDLDPTHYYTPAAGTAPTALAPTFPTLYVQKLLNPPPQPPVINIPFESIKCDSGFVVPAQINGNAGTVQSVTYQSYAFTGKKLTDLLLYAMPSAASGYMLPSIKSPGQASETINFIINGTKYIPDNGIDTPAIKLQYLIGTNGSYTLPMMCEAYGMFAAGSITTETNAVGNLSLCAVAVDAVLTTQIQVEYSRTNPAAPTADQTGAFTMLLFGGESQVLSINAGRASISLAS